MSTRLTLTDPNSTDLRFVQAQPVQGRRLLISEKSMRPSRILPTHSMSKMKSLKPCKLQMQRN